MSGSLYPRMVAVQNRYVKILYLDLNTDYTLTTKQLLLENLNAVNNELLNLILTMPGELAFEPDFGSQIPNLLFEQPTTVNNWMIGNYLFTAVARWLPNVIIDFKNSIIQPLVSDAGYYFKLVYSVNGINGGGNADFRFQT